MCHVPCSSFVLELSISHLSFISLAGRGSASVHHPPSLTLIAIFFRCSVHERESFMLVSAPPVYYLNSTVGSQ